MAGTCIRFDSLINVTLATRNADTLPDIRGTFDILKNHPKFLLYFADQYKGIERLVM